jgi:hypothetical protein
MELQNPKLFWDISHLITSMSPALKGDTIAALFINNPFFGVEFPAIFENLFGVFSFWQIRDYLAIGKKRHDRFLRDPGMAPRCSIGFNLARLHPLQHSIG